MGNIVNLVYQQDSTLSQNILTLARYCKIAHVGKTLEDKFVRWHSCLDFLTQRLNRGGRNPSKRIIRAFQDCDLPINDLIEQELIAKILEKDSKTKLPFTKIRDEFIHKGFNSITKKPRESLNQLKIMIALAERLLLHNLNIDYRDTHLGIPKPV